MPEMPLTPEELERLQKEQEAAAIEQAENEWNAEWLQRHPVPEIPAAERKEYGPEAAIFDSLCADFERNHSVAELYAVIELSAENPKSHPIREPARVALIPIDMQLKKLEKETNIPPEQYDALRQKYKYLRMAVGIINNGKVDHTR